MRTKWCMSSVSLAMTVALLCLGARGEAQTARRVLSPTEVDPVEIEAFRADLTRYAEEMKAVAVAARLPSELDSALREVSALSDTDLSALQAAFAKSPNWRTYPQTLKSLIRRGRRGAPPEEGSVGPRITADDCPTAISWGYTQTDIEIAADVALAADVILEAIPNDVLGAIARGVAVGLWAIPQGVLRGFEHLYNIAQACESAAFESGVNTQLVSIVNNDNANKTQIITNDNSNRNTIINNDNANAASLTTTVNANTTAILANSDANRAAVVAELRALGCEIVRLLNTAEGQRASSILACQAQPNFPYKWPGK